MATITSQYNYFTISTDLIIILLLVIRIACRRPHTRPILHNLFRIILLTLSLQMLILTVLRRNGINSTLAHGAPILLEILRGGPEAVGARALVLG